MFKVIGPLSIALSIVASNPTVAGDAAAGDKRYHESCHACHGPAGKGCLVTRKFRVTQLSIRGKNSWPIDRVRRLAPTRDS